jgi:Tfp pilus assembly protein PilN
MAKQEGVSLLPKEENRLDQVSNWILETGRWIVVFTLFFVLLAFLSRFWLDQKIADLYAKTAQKIAIVEASTEFENEFRLLQSQIESIKTLDAQKPNQAEKIKKIIALLPEDIYLNSIKISDSDISFDIISQNETALNTLFQNLILCPYLDEINIASISSKTFGLETELSIKAKFTDL